MTYDELRAALSGYVHRSDAQTIANEPAALELARVKVNRGFFPAESLVLVSDLAVLDGKAQLPADFGSADTVSQAAKGDLQYETPRSWARLVGVHDTKGRFTVTGSTMLVDGSLEVVSVLYNKVAEAIGTTGSNWLSEKFPDVWLWQAIAEQHRFVQDYESAQMAEEYSGGLARAAELDSRMARQGGSLRMVTRR